MGLFLPPKRLFREMIRTADGVFAMHTPKDELGVLFISGQGRTAIAVLVNVKKGAV